MPKFAIFDEPERTSTPPANHFLAPRPASPPRAASPAEAWVEGARPDTSSLAAADYDVSVRTGFLPPEPPVARLGKELGGFWDAYEDCLEWVQEESRRLDAGGVGRIGGDWRQAVREVRISLAHRLIRTHS